MSSPVTTTLSPFGTTAQTAVLPTLSLTDAPLELQIVPAGTVFPAVITPPETISELPVITLTLPDGGEFSFPLKLPHVPMAEMSVGLKVQPPEIKNAFSFKLHFSAPPPDIKEAGQALRETAAQQKAVIETPVKPATVQAFVLHSVPEQIAALLPETDEVPALPVFPSDGKISIELTPLFEEPPVAERPESPAPSFFKAETTPLRKAPEPETAKSAPPPERNTFEPTPVTTEKQPEAVLKPAALESVSPLPENAFAGFSVSTEPTAFPVAANETAPVPTRPDALPVFPETARPKHIEMKADFSETTETAAQPPVPAKSLETPPSLPVLQRKMPETPTVTDAPLSAAKPENDRRPVPLKGVVFRTNAEAPTLIVTKAGVLAVEENIRLPHLTPVAVKIQPPPVEDESPVPAQRPVPEFKNTWTVLTGALDTLRETDSAAFEAVKNVLPQVGGKLPALMLSFMNAAAQGVPFASFIGEANVSALRATEKGERLLKRLEKEFSASPKKATDGQNAWKGWDIPFLTGSVVEPVSLFLQRPADDGFRHKGSAQKQHNVRFVLDLNLTKLGKIQMEGLAHRPERRFDLILRHQNDLPSSFSLTVQGIFTQTLAALNYAGTLKVDKTDDFIVFTDTGDNDSKRGVLV